MLRQTKEPVHCPVCDEIIGDRWIQQPIASYCKECRFTYYFKAHETVPHKNMRGKVEDKGCNCGRCGR